MRVAFDFGHLRRFYLDDSVEKAIGHETEGAQEEGREKAARGSPQERQGRAARGCRRSEGLTARHACMPQRASARRRDLAGVARSLCSCARSAAPPCACSPCSVQQRRRALVRRARWTWGSGGHTSGTAPHPPDLGKRRCERGLPETEKRRGGATGGRELASHVPVAGAQGRRARTRRRPGDGELAEQQAPAKSIWEGERDGERQESDAEEEEHNSTQYRAEGLGIVGGYAAVQ